MALFLTKNHLLRCWGCLSRLNWIGALTLSLFLKVPPRKLEPCFFLCGFFLLRLLCIYKSTIRPCMEYFCHVWAGAPRYYFETVFPSLATSLEPLAHRRNVASLIFPIGISVHLKWLSCFHFLVLEGRSTRYSDRLYDFSVTIPRCCKDVFLNSFFPHTARFWNSLPIECFPLTHNPNGL